MTAQLVSVATIMERTGFSKPAIYRMAREGRIPAVRIGRSIRFDTAAIDRWMSKLPKASS